MSEMKLEIDNDTEQQIGLLKIVMQEYEAEAKKMEQIMEVLHISPRDLSEKVQTALKDLAVAAKDSGLRTASQTSFLLSASEHILERAEKAEKEAENRYREAVLSSKNKILSSNISLINSALKMATKEEEILLKVQEEHLKKLPEVDSHRTKLSSRIFEMETEQKQQHICEDIDYATVLEEFYETDRLGKEIAELEEKNAEYCSLPTSLKLARRAVEEAREEFVKLDRELDLAVSSMHA